MPDKLKLNKIKGETFDELVGLETDREVNLPNLSFNSDQVPEVKDWNPPEDYWMIIKVKEKRKTVDKDGKVRGDFDVTAYKDLTAVYNKPIKDMTDEEFGEHQGEELDKASKHEKQ